MLQVGITAPFLYMCRHLYPIMKQADMLINHQVMVELQYTT